MKKFVICAAALGLFAFTPLSAQSNEHRGEEHGAPAHANNAHPAGASRQEQRGPAATPQNRQGPAMRTETHGNAGNAHPTMNRGAVRAAAPQNTPNNFLPGSGDVRQTPHGGRGQNDVSRPGNAMQTRQATGNANRPALNAYRRNIQAPQKFHSGSYRAPQGYSYRHWSYGETLPRGYYARNYWISDFLTFGLFAPPADLIWVRVGNDALLIDRYSGDIVQVRYGVFY